MRVLLVIRSLELGGAERQCRALAVSLAARGHDVMLCTLGDGGPLSSGLAESKVTVCSLSHRGPRDLLRSCLRLRALMKRAEPDVVYSFMSVSNVMSTLASPRQLRSRLVWGIRSGDTGKYDFSSRIRFMFFLEKILGRLARLVILNSEAGRRFYESLGFRSDSLRVIENAIDTSTFDFDLSVRESIRNVHQVPSGTRIVTILARIDPIKGYETFIDAAAKVIDETPDTEFWSIGGGSSAHKEELVCRARARGLDRHLKWHGEIRDSKSVAAILMASDLAVSASTSEGFPNSVAECLACGLRVVGTDAGDTRRLIGDSGECVAVGDFNAMGDAIQRELKRDSTRPQVRAEFIRRFDPVCLVDRHESLLNDVARQELST